MKDSSAFIMMTNRFTRRQRMKIKQTAKKLSKHEKRDVSENEVVRRAIDYF